ncbi:MAG: orotate phosphoribosyltransferase [Acidobacteria bacterium]|nr:orotate phosphoribosyltransferase [Acidobacteriota bacterium]
MKPDELAQALLDLGAVRLSPRDPFTWASGLRAPIYCDNRLLLGHPGIRRRIVTALAERAARFHPTLIGGTATAGVPWAAMVAQDLDLPMAYARPERKNHGMGRRVEGSSPAGHRVVLMEDLISTGGSSLRCAEVLREEGAEVLEVLALFSYGLPRADEAFRAAGIPLHTLATFDVLRATALARGLLDAADDQALAEWRADTGGWSRRFEDSRRGGP